MKRLLSDLLVLTLFGAAATVSTLAQNQSVGGKEHDSNIYGVKIGMDVPTALQTVFVNANRKAGEERPDAKRNEGKDNKDVRVLYKNLPLGNLQIVFAEGKWVREIILEYKTPPRIFDLRLPFSGDIGSAIRGERYDDRYTIGYTDDRKRERIWWREENIAQDYKIQVSFVSGKITTAGSLENVSIVRKAISVVKTDYDKFIKAMQK